LKELTFDHVTHPDDLVKTRELAGKLFRGEIPHFQVRTRDVRKSGDAVWVRLTQTLIRDDQGAPLHVVGMIEDLTEERQRERDVHLARFTLDHAQEVVAWTGPDGRIADVNRSACRVLGYSRQELLSMKVCDIDQAVSAESWPEVWKQLRQEGFLVQESSLRRKDGGEIPVELGVSYVEYDGAQYACTIARDIRERQKTAAELATSEARYRALFENAAAMVATIDLKGNVTAVNKALERFSGLTRERLVGRNAVALFPPDQYKILQSMLERKLREGGTTSYDLEVPMRNGLRRPVRLTSTLLEEDGEPVGVQAIAIDITDQKEAEKAWLRSQMELRALAARLLSNEEEQHRSLARELHDDLGQRLTALGFDLAALEAACPQDTPVDLKKRLQTARTRLADLSEDLQRLVHQLHPSFLELTGLPAALQGLCREASQHGQYSVRFRASQLPKWLSPEVALCLYRVTQECLRNIAKHAQGDKVSVVLSGLDQGLRLSVRDNGVGYDVAMAPSKGGIGLISIRERVQLVGGTLTIRTRPGRGTQVTVEVPMSGPPSANSAK
jgi:PAS domain S-box-containing protein